MLTSTMPLPVSAEAFPRSGEGVEERSDETDEGAPLDGANGYSPLIRHFVPPVPLLALCATSPGAGESFPKGGRL